VKQQGGFLSNEEPVASFNFSIPSSAVDKTSTLSVEFYPAPYDEIIQLLRRIILQPNVCIYCLEGNILLRSLVINAFNEQSKSENVERT